MQTMGRKKFITPEQEQGVGRVPLAGQQLWIAWNGSSRTGSRGLLSEPIEFVFTVPCVERLCLDTTPGERAERGHHREGMLRAEQVEEHSVAIRAPFSEVTRRERFSCSTYRLVFLLPYKECRVRAGSQGRLVLQEGWQELMDPLLPQHKALSLLEPPARQKATSAHGKAGEMLRTFKGNKGHLKPTSPLGPPRGGTPERVAFEAPHEQAACWAGTVTRGACSGTRPAARRRPAGPSRSRCSTASRLRPRLSALSKEGQQQSGQGGV